MKPIEISAALSRLRAAAAHVRQAEAKGEGKPAHLVSAIKHLSDLEDALKIARRVGLDVVQSDNWTTTLDAHLAGASAL